VPLQPLAALTIATGSCWILLRLLIPQLRRSLLDRPNARSSHRVPIPRGGGIAFVLVGSLLAPLAGIGWSAWIPLLCSPLALVGMVDDHRDLPASLRYAAQAITALVLVSIATLPLPWWLLPLVVIATTAVINFVNFMDGLDGLVAGCFLVVLGVAAAAEPGRGALWPLVGALVAFLFWNWSPAKVFMGDVGSTFLGAVFAGVVLQQPTPAAAMALLLVGFPLLGDAFFCVMRRLASGQAVFQAHRLHLFQRLHRAGWSHALVSLLYGGATAALGLALLAGGLPAVIPLVAAELVIGLWLDRRVAVPFSEEPAGALPPRLP
jgi:Fuc2NAc and GlcNAc transferase